MKPMPNDYTLPQGIYLFLGYSEVDERELNRNHTVIVLQDVVRVLQQIIEEEAVNGVSTNFSCKKNKPKPHNLNFVYF